MIDKVQIISFIIANAPEYNVRCHSCGWLLAKRMRLTEGHIEIKCPKCKSINKIMFN